MYKNSMLVMMVLLSICVGSQLVFAVAPGPYLFDYNIRNNNLALLFPDYVPVPFPGYDYAAGSQIFQQLYLTLFAENKPIGLILIEATNPVDGHTGPFGAAGKDALKTEVEGSYPPPRLDFVFGDFEDPNKAGWVYSSRVAAEVNEMVKEVRATPSPDMNSAYISNYDDYPGPNDVSIWWPNQNNRTARSNYYLNSGLNVASPGCYPYAVYVIHTWPSQWGTNVAPNARSALLWAPLEKFSVAKRSLPTGHLLIPWVAHYIMDWGKTYVIPESNWPTRGDVVAFIQHIRLRGADGFYRLCGILDPNTSEIDNSNQNRSDMLTGWHSLDRIFEGPGDVNVLNLTTNKTGGIQWSGVQHGSKIAILVSNLGNSSQRVALPSLPGLPAYSDYVAPGQHVLKFYDIILPSADACVKTNGTITNALYTSWFNSDASGVRAYLKFDVNDLAPPNGFRTKVNSLKLRTYAPAVSGSLGVYDDALFSVSDDSWLETSLTWANKPGENLQLSAWQTRTSAGLNDINSLQLKQFVEDQANGDGVASFEIRDLDAAKTNNQYQHYYDREESTVNCFRLVAEYEVNNVSTMQEVTDPLYASDYVTISDAQYKVTTMLFTGYYYGHCVNYIKWDISSLAPPTGYSTVVDNVLLGLKTISSNFKTYTDAFYETTDDWSSGTMAWATKPPVGPQLVTWQYPGPGTWVYPTSTALKQYIQSEANGDGVLSLFMDDVNAVGTTNSDSHAYYADYNYKTFEPELTVSYHFELLGTPADCQAAISRGFSLQGDLNQDCYVNFKDFGILAERWLSK